MRGCVLAQIASKSGETFPLQVADNVAEVRILSAVDNWLKCNNKRIER